MADPVSSTLQIEWASVGAASLDSGGKVKFPKLPAKAGLYQFHIEGPNGDRGRYVGEADNLQRRFAHYRNPGPTQPTNSRLNAFVKEVLLKGGNVGISIVVDRASITRRGQKEVADFEDKNMRRLFENLVLVLDKANDVLELNK